MSFEEDVYILNELSMRINALIHAIMSFQGIATLITLNDIID